MSKRSVSLVESISVSWCTQESLHHLDLVDFCSQVERTGKIAMQIFTTIKFILKVLTIYSFDHPKSEWIKWILRSICVCLVSYTVMGPTYIIISASSLIDCMEPTMLAITFTFILGTFLFLLWKRAVAVELIENLQMIHDKGNLLPTAQHSINIFY